MDNHPVFTLSQVAQHKSKKDCWLVIDGRVINPAVLNVTKFMEEHPGGEEMLIEWAGKDATNQFKDIGHSRTAHNMLLNYQVGVLQGYALKEGGVKDASVREFSTSKQKEMTAFIIKEDGMPEHPGFLEFFVPLLLAASYFGYRYVTNVVN